MNNVELIVNKNNTAILNTGNREVELSPIYRLDKNTKFNLYVVRTGKVILTTYAIPNKAQRIKLSVIGTSRNGYKLETINTKNLIVKNGYVAKRGCTMKLS